VKLQAAAWVTYNPKQHTISECTVCPLLVQCTVCWSLTAHHLYQHCWWVALQFSTFRCMTFVLPQAHSHTALVCHSFLPPEGGFSLARFWVYHPYDEMHLPPHPPPPHHHHQHSTTKRTCTSAQSPAIVTLPLHSLSCRLLAFLRVAPRR
jgi:hypothetical protein